MLQKGAFSRLTILMGMGLFATTAYAAHDLACYEIIEPSGDYLEANSSMIPKLGIANLGDEAEFSFPVEFLVIDKEGLLEYENDTVFAETTRVEYIGPYPDSIEVEFDEWVPEGICDPYSPFVEYELIGIVDLEADEDRANDTLRDSVTCLWSHDVGVIDIELGPEPDELPDIYHPGTQIEITATVENFGYHMGQDVPVRLKITDEYADTLVYNNVKNISSLDWRGNPYDNPYIIEVTFPNWTIPSYNSFDIECRTEMEEDQCPNDDADDIYLNEIEEVEEIVNSFILTVPNTMVEGECRVQFAVLYFTLVKVDVFDVSGCLVKTLHEKECEPGHYGISWDAKDQSGRKVASGVYLIRMQADEFKDVRKIVIMN
jgi:hypothetical protein